jgi:Exostosin family
MSVSKGSGAGFGRILVPEVAKPGRIVQKQVRGENDMLESSEAPVVFAKFVNDEILGEMGRLLFSLLNVFVVSGYHIRLADNLPPAKLDKYGQMARSLQSVTLTDAVPSETSGMIYLFDEEDRTVGARAWRKKIQVRFDVFSPYWFTQPMLMPYPVHPVHTGPDLRDRLQKYRASERKMRVFFSGDREGYVRNRIRYPKPKLARLDVINAILQGMDEKVLLVQDEANLDSACSRGYVNKCLIMDQSQSRIDQTRWLQTLATSDFFLCPPGFVMPMCHNTVEAMAVGAIPIINYPEWFDPHLEHRKNCIVFDDKVDLLDKLNEVLQMDGNEIARMRREVADYYDNRLAPESFVRRIESSKRDKVVVLMITDANVTKHASRLNARSVLMRGTAATR